MVQPQLSPHGGADGPSASSSRGRSSTSSPTCSGTLEGWSSTGNVIYIELRLEGTVGAAAFEMHTCDRITLRDGKAIERVAYLDPAPLLARRRSAARAHWPRFVTDPAPQPEERRRSMKEVTLPQGTIHYRDSGSGEPIVFVARAARRTGSLWRKVDAAARGPTSAASSPTCRSDPTSRRWTRTRTSPPRSRPHRRRVHRRHSGSSGSPWSPTTPAARSARSPPPTTPSGRAGSCSPTATRSRTSCRRFFRPLQWAAKVPGLLTGVCRARGSPRCAACPLGFGWLIKHDPRGHRSRNGSRPYLHDRGVRRDTIKVLRGIDPEYTLRGGREAQLASTGRRCSRGPARTASSRSRFAERLAETIPGARLERIDDSYTFVSEDQPERLAELIRDFVREPARAAA